PFEVIGGFDEDYWMYWEDADLCARLGEHGHATVFEPAALVQHATSSSPISADTVRSFHRSAARFYERHVADSRRAVGAARAVLRSREAVAVAAHRAAGVASP